ncbi:MAG TPA: hypothetical protein VFO89_06825 [Thermoanaerobaculia bacterium]|nr:hypothetical protein [Thermoanaerobaculia bacterium]
MSSVVAGVSAAVIVAMSVSSLFAVGPRDGERRPWEWKLEDRAAARSDALLARQRVEVNAARVSRRAGFQVVDIIDGRTSPELFMPTALFESLIKRGYLGNGAWREIHARDLRTAGLPSDFWEQLEVDAAPFIDVVRRRDEAARSVARHPRDAEKAEAMIVALDLELCRTRAAALARARSRFGPPFDEFLYAHVAPGITVWTDELPDSSSLLFKEGGCQ